MADTNTTYPPTQYLVMEVLAARHRLGEQFWPFPQNCRQPIDALADAGLVHIVKDSDVVGSIRVRLTDKGLTEWGLDDTGRMLELIATNDADALRALIEGQPAERTTTTLLQAAQRLLSRTS